MSAPAPTQDRFAALVEQVRLLRERLHFQLGAGLYLYYYQPLSADTALAGANIRGTLQVFYYYLQLDTEVHGFGAHTEVRLRDGGHVGPSASNTFFRGFYTSNLWFQEVYAYYTPGPYLKLKAGKIHRLIGLFWDDSFFGNLPFYDGIMLNPDYGLSAEGRHDLLGGRIGLTGSVQYFVQSDGINGGLDFARTLSVPVPTSGGASIQDPTSWRLGSPNPEGQRDGAGALLAIYRDVFTMRLALSARPTKRLDLTLGGSLLTGVIERASTHDLPLGPDTARVTQAEGDVTLSAGPIVVFGEYLRQYGPGARDADYLLCGAQASAGPVSLRFNASYVRYQLDPDIEEFMLVPGVTYRPGYGVTLFLEYDEWQRRDPRLGETYAIYDRSLNLALGYSY